MKKVLLPLILFLFTLHAEAQTITTSTVSGSIFACAGSVSVSPYLQQFNVSGSGLSTGITVTAPAGFEISLSSGSGYGTTLTIPETGGTVTAATVYVHSAATAPAGAISGNILLSSAGASTQNVAVSGTVNGLPSANVVGNQTVSNGTPTAPITFSGTGIRYQWVNNTPGIGLAASGSGNISSFTAINTGNTPVTATITVTPQNITSQYAYVACAGAYPQDIGVVTVINTVTNTVTANISTGNLISEAACVSPDGSLVYVGNHNSNNISVINALTNSIIATIPSGMNPYFLAISPDGTRLYVTNDGAATVTVINTSNYAIVATIPVGTYPSGIAISPDGSTAYCVNQASNTVSVINTATNTVTATVTVGSSPLIVVVSPDGSKVYVTNQASSTVSVISTATNAVTATISTGVYTFPDGMAISPDGTLLYVSDANNSAVLVINTATNAVVNKFYVGGGPAGICVTPDGSQIYVANESTNDVSVINAATGTVTATLPAGNIPVGFGNFISAGLPCSGTPITFTIMVNPVTATILTNPAVGTITSCQGTPSASPAIAQFTVSGKDLTDNITATAPTGFDVSLSAGGPWSASVTISPNGATVNNVTVYIRSAASAPAGTISGDVVLSTLNATSQSVAVSGTIAASATMAAVPNQVVINGSATSSVTFSGSGDAYTWVNNTPGIGLPASGNDSIASFTAINTSHAPVTATITVTPSLTGSSCGGIPQTFTITADPTDSILAGLASGTITACTGTASSDPSVEQVYISGYGLTGDITATAPTGFEVSLSAAGTFGNSVTIAQTAGIVNNTPIYVRSASTAVTGNILGVIALSSAGAKSQQVAVYGNVMPMVTPSVSIRSSGVTVCAGTPVTFTATPTNGGASPQYQWLVNNTNAGSNDSTFTSAGLNTGDVVSCLLTSNTACAVSPDAASNNITINILPAIVPTVTISASDNNVCSGTTITFTASPTNGGSSPSYVWMINSVSSGDTTADFTSKTLENGDSVTCVLTSSLTCGTKDSSAAVYMVIYPAPTVAFSPDTVYTINGNGVALSPIVTGPVDKYQWSPSLGLNDTAIANPTANPTNENIYQLLVTTAQGCTAFGKVAVIAGRPLVMPNAFTPDRANNAVFRIPPGVQFDLAEFDIFDRWGIRVFSTRNIGEGWNGTYSGQPVTPGTYVYLISGKTQLGKPVVLQGTVMVIK